MSDSNTMVYSSQSSYQRERLHQLQQCLSLAKDVTSHAEAKAHYHHFRDRLADEAPDLVELLDVMWSEILNSRRSAGFWEDLCNVERKLTDRMAESNVQLRQNYLRLVQEQ